MVKFFIIFLLMTLEIANAQVRMGHLFVMISDAMENVKNGNYRESIPILENFKTEFYAIPTHNSEAGVGVNKVLEVAIKNPNLELLESLSMALLTFEKEQNPIDYMAQIQQFGKRIMPVFKQLEKATMEKNIKELPLFYKRFYDIWQRNERIVGDISPGHYGQIEKALALHRIAFIGESVDFETMNLEVQKIGMALKEFLAGNILQTQNIEDAPQTLPQALGLLHQAFMEFSQNQSLAKDKILIFIAQWPLFEGEVRTRDSSLYNRIESELPEIAARGATQENLDRLENLIKSIESLNLNADFTAFDIAIVLLREGIEALLIIMALLTALQAANQSKGRIWVIGGAILGVGMSLIVAVAFMQFFPFIAGKNREILEGIVGIIAVVMMLFIGAWLHSKSKVANWQTYISKQIGKAFTQGSLLGLGFLAFLAVFREGAETILFYAGMMSRITMGSFLMGIGFACLGLAIIAYLMKTFAQRLPIHWVFLSASWFIYILGFKILGVSIHALQLTNVVPIDILPLPTVTFFGFYNSLQGFMGQMFYIMLVVIILIWQKYIQANAKSVMIKKGS